MSDSQTGLPVFDFNHWTAHQLGRVEMALSSWVTADSPADLGHPMRYAVLDGGKRLRPLLVLAAAEAGQPADPVAALEAATRAACAVELIHAYSLVHDDMPCMDNDVLRRGKPTVHVQFGEAQALLAGDALQALAFELLVPEDGSMPPHCQHSCADNWHWQPVCTAWPVARRLTWPALACGSRKTSLSRCTALKQVRCCKPA
jgi:farnesyl diphosphate synthase